MVVFFHILIATLSVVFATSAFLKPSRLLFRVSYGFIAATLISGMYLVWLAPAKMLHVCISGLLYTVVISAITVAAQVRYAQLQKSEQK